MKKEVKLILIGVIIQTVFWVVNKLFGNSHSNLTFSIGGVLGGFFLMLGIIIHFSKEKTWGAFSYWKKIAIIIMAIAGLWIILGYLQFEYGLFIKNYYGNVCDIQNYSSPYHGNCYKLSYLIFPAYLYLFFGSVFRHFIGDLISMIIIIPYFAIFYGISYLGYLIISSMKKGGGKKNSPKNKQSDNYLLT